MTREELFSAFPRPWRHDDKAPGLVLDANGAEVLTVDVWSVREDDMVVALADVLVELGNAAEDGSPSAAAEVGLDLAAGKSQAVMRLKRKVCRGGVWVMSRQYYSPSLHALHGRVVTVEFDPRTDGPQEVYVIARSGERFAANMMAPK